MAEVPQKRGAATMPKGVRFGEGQIGNPGGRPKSLKEVEALARTFTVAAIEGLAAIATNEEAPAAARIAAFNSVLDRAWGKPKQAVEHSGADGETLNFTLTVVRPE